MAKLAINGGDKTCTRPWPKWPITGDPERQALLGVLESGKWWYGEKVREFEAAFAAFQSAKFGVTASSGTTALEVALVALGVGAGAEVIVPPYTFLATASAVLRVNAIPIFADIEPDTLCIDPADIERKITDQTKAIIPVHMTGYVADMDRINALAKRHKLSVVEDACHSWGSQWKGKGTGALGQCGAFSFQASKNLNSGEGGIILTDDEALADTCRSYANCGRGKDTPWYEHYLLGSNLRLTEFHAALLLAQMTRLEEQTRRRAASARILDEGLAKIPGIKVLRPEPRMTRRAYHLYPFRLDRKVLGVPEEKFIEALRAEGAPVGKGYDRPLYANPLFQRNGDGAKYCPLSCPYYGRKIDYTQVRCAVCEQAVVDTVWVYQSPLLADDDAIRSIVAAVRKVAENTKELR